MPLLHEERRHFKVVFFLYIRFNSWNRGRRSSVMALNGGDSSPADYLSLVQSLLGSSNVLRSKILPDEIKYVMIALSSEQGPLSNLLVTSGLLTEVASAPARLSLLPRSSVWANGAIEGCVDGSNATGRIAEAR